MEIKREAEAFNSFLRENGVYDCDNNLDLLSVYRYCVGALYFCIISILKACKVDSLINSHIEEEIEVLERLSP